MSIGETKKPRQSAYGEEHIQNAKEFAAEIDAWDAEDRPENDVFILDSTGDVLQGLGAIESDIYMRSEKINTILTEHPEMTLSEIKKIPQILNDPILILKSRNAGRAARQNSRLILFSSVKAQNRKPVLIALDLKPTENHLVLAGMQKITSSYTKTSNAVNFVRNSDVLHIDTNKKRAASLLQTIGFQMPIEWQRVGSIGSISYAGNIVNIQGTSFDEVVETADAFSEESRQLAYGEEEYLTLAKDPEKNEARLQKMVDEAAKKKANDYRISLGYIPPKTFRMLVFYSVALLPLIVNIIKKRSERRIFRNAIFLKRSDDKIFFLVANAGKDKCHDEHGETDSQPHNGKTVV